jgi:uncharacterized protein (DUF169 family)
MGSPKQDLSIFNKFNFEYSPIGVKFLYRRPQGIEQLDKRMAICEMIKEAQQRDNAFYMAKENEECFGAVTLGMVDMPPFAEAGQVGIELTIFKEARANSRVYNYLPRLQSGVVNYVAFAKLDKIPFDPDLLIITANVQQAEILFRALDHYSGAPRESKTTGVFGCAWLFTYPYQTGKVNYTVSGLHFGSKAKQVFPEGLIIICVPFDWLPPLIDGLNEITWEHPAYQQSVSEFKEWERQIMDKLEKESHNL